MASQFKICAMIREEVRTNLDVIELDMNAEGVLPSVNNLQPFIFKGGNSVCVIERHSPWMAFLDAGRRRRGRWRDL